MELLLRRGHSGEKRGEGGGAREVTAEHGSLGSGSGQVEGQGEAVR